MFNSRRFCVVAAVLGLSIVLAVVAIQAKELMARVPPPQSNLLATVSLTSNRQAQQVMAKGQELIDEREFAKACEALQYLLSLKEDNFVRVARAAPGGKDAVLYVSIRSEANRLLGTLPAEGLKLYEQLYGREAAARLAEGRAASDPQLLAAVAQRYFHTEAGAQATELLATRCLERDEFLTGALYFERLLARPDAGRLSALTLFKAALAFHRAGDRGNGEEAWKLLTAKAKRDGGVTLGDEVVSLERLRAEIDKAAKEEPHGLHDWPNYRGAPDRSGQGIVGTIDLGQVFWELSTTDMDKKGQASKGWIEELVNTGTKALEQQNQPVLPAHHPIAVNGKVFVPTYDGVYAADLRQKDEKLLWWAHTDSGVRGLFDGSNRQQALTGWWNTNQNQGYKTWGPQSILFENSLTGTLSTDNARVFAVDDLPLPPHPFLFQNFQFGIRPNFGSLDDLVKHNSLKCYHLEFGKIVWSLGGKGNGDSPAHQRFQESRFLSAPLALNGKLYLLNEKAGGIYLVCLETKDTTDNSQLPPEVMWDQPLAELKDKDAPDPGRRIHAAHVSYGEGFLVCPTNAGAVVAVDLLTHSLAWAHHYREAAPEPAGPPNRRRPAVPFPANGMNGAFQLTNEWRHSAPAIAGGKVVFTAPDSTDLICLNLRDGRRAWKQPRAADDLYFAGIYQNKAVVVGKNYVRAYQLTDGAKVWDSSEATGMPTGQGVAAGNVYYLPAKNASREPEIVALSLADGKVTAHIKSDRKDLLGNLIFHDGFLISQTASSVTAFPLK